MNRQQFKEAIAELRKFEKERTLLDNVLNAISASSTGVVDFGGYFIESYIKVLEIALKSPLGWVSAFVFECDYGNYPFTGAIDGKDFSVQTEDEFYDLVVSASPNYTIEFEEGTELTKEILDSIMGGNADQPNKEI